MNTNPANTLKYPEPDPVLIAKPSLKKYLRYLAFFGPGAVLASMTIGQGQLILAPQLGAWAGYAFLWIITLNIGSYIIAYTGCRFSLLAGIGPMSVFATKTRSGWMNWIFIVIILIFIPMFTAAIITTMGQSLTWIFGRGHYLVWGISFSLLAASLVLAGRYKILELSQALFVAFLGIGAIVSVIKIRPDLTEMLPNFFRFGNIPAYPEWMVTNFPVAAGKPVALLMLGMLGTLSVTIIPLIGYLGWIRVKKWGIYHNQADPDRFSEELFARFRSTGTVDYLPDSKPELEKSRLLLKPLIVDLAVAFFIVSLVSICYMTAGKHLLGPQLDGSFKLPSDINLLKEQAVIFSHIAPILTPLYKISIIFALFGTVYAGFEAVARMLYETAKDMLKPVRETQYNKFIIYLLVYILCTGVPLAILIFSGVSVLIMLSVTLLFIGVVGVIIYGIGVVVISQTVLPAPYRLRGISLYLALGGIFCMSLPVILVIFK
ncbi:MAG: Nramp family divalent metal transporter [Candidatus Neomarinimicrobiota bacterium]